MSLDTARTSACATFKAALLACSLAVTLTAADPPILHYHIAGDEPGSWPRILSSIGLLAGAEGTNAVYVIPAGATADLEQWRNRVRDGAIVILEGASELAAAFGIKPEAGKKVPVQAITDVHDAKLELVWEKSIDVSSFELPADAKIFSRDRHRNMPLAAGLRHGKGAVLWLAVSPGPKGHERFPYIAQALGDLGLHPPFRSRRLWAFFDASYRSRVDLDWFATQWRQSGIAALHVAAWHFHEPDAQRDEYLRKLIEAAHQRGILVYAWVELPHVSEQFWRDHPEWREKTAIGQDAHLDWRKLMNLANPDCARAVATGIDSLLTRFDWDGVNLAELYFESLEGHGNAARFTPMSDEPRAEFREAAGFDPKELFDDSSARHWSRNAPGLREFLDWRGGRTQRLQEEWLARLEDFRKKKPYMDLVLTHVDDRYDRRMRDLIGADAERLLPLLEQRDFTFLIEDPATLWHLGAERYADIAAQYKALTPRTHKLAIDLNIVERYQDVYPARQQTGTELFQLVNQAARAFPRVALYFENSILPQDRAWLASAAAAVSRVERAAGKLIVESPAGLGARWKGDAVVNGRVWPATDGETIWLPAGRHAIEPSKSQPSLRLLDFSGDLQSASALVAGLEIGYRSDARVFALFDRQPLTIEVDGEPIPAAARKVEAGWQITLPRGQHLVMVRSTPTS